MRVLSICCVLHDTKIRLCAVLFYFWRDFYEKIQAYPSLPVRSGHHDRAGTAARLHQVLRTAAGEGRRHAVVLPIFLFCSRWGFGPGMLASFAFSLLQLFLDGAYAWVWQSIVGDYILGFTVLGFAGLFSKKRFGFFYGALLGCALRFLCSYITGVVAWGEYMPEVFFGMTMTTPWFYSALYNGFYMVTDCILVLLVGWFLWKPMGKYIRRR